MPGTGVSTHSGRPTIPFLTVLGFVVNLYPFLLRYSLYTPLSQRSNSSKWIHPECRWHNSPIHDNQAIVDPVLVPSEYFTEVRSDTPVSGSVIAKIHPADGVNGNLHIVSI